MNDREASRSGAFGRGPNTGTFWAWVPAGLLGSMLLGLGTMAFIAIDDPHFALEPNYYDKAVHWDQAQAEAKADRALGMKLDLRPLAISYSGQIDLVLTLKDRGDFALTGAEVELQAFPNAYAGRIEQLLLRETAPGVYTGQLEHGMRGLWELRFLVKPAAGAATYREVLRRDVAKAGAA
jgi:hypothetical protein